MFPATSTTRMKPRTLGAQWIGGIGINSKEKFPIDRSTDLVNVNAMRLATSTLPRPIREIGECRQTLSDGAFTFTEDDRRIFQNLSAEYASNPDGFARKRFKHGEALKLSRWYKRQSDRPLSQTAIPTDTSISHSNNRKPGSNPRGESPGSVAPDSVDPSKTPVNQRVTIVSGTLAASSPCSPANPRIRGLIAL